MQVNIHEAKTHFSKLIAQVLCGEEVIIAKSGKPVAQIIPITLDSSTRTPGSAKGKIVVHDDFMDPLPEDVQETFES